MKPFHYGIVGLLLGGLLGLVVGGQNRYLSKTEKVETGESTAWIWTVAFAVVGAVSGGNIAAKIEKEEQEEKIKADTTTIEEEKEGAENQLILQVKKELGIWRFNTQCFKTVKHWMAETKWTDNRNGKGYILKTGRSLTGDIITTINGKHLITHDRKTANKYVIPVLHEKARNIVFKRLLRKFVEDRAFSIEKLYGLPDS